MIPKNWDAEPSGHQREWDLKRAQIEAHHQEQKRRRQEFEDTIGAFDSGGYNRGLISRLQLIDHALDCASDGNGPPNLEGCFALIRFVEKS